MSVLKRAFEAVQGMWKGMKPSQRFALAALAGILALVVVFAGTAGGADGMRVLAGPEVGAETRAQVKAKLAELGYSKYKVTPDAVLVPTEDLDSLMLEMVGAGIYSDAQLFKWLDEVNLTSTSWDRKRRWDVSVQRRLEGMIRQIEGVGEARVQITPAQELTRLGFAGGQDAKASVKVTLKAGKRELSQSQVDGMAHLVAGAVGDLKPSKVHIMDNRKLYRVTPEEESLGGVDQRRATEEEYERRFQEKLNTWLTPVAMKLGGELYSSVFVRLSSSETRTHEEKHGPDAVAVEKDRSESIKNVRPSGMKGMESVPPAPEATETQRSVKEKYAIDKSFTDTVVRPGDVQSVSVAIALAVYEDATPELTAKLAESETTLVAEVKKAMAAYFKSEGDVSVQLVPVKKKAEEAPTAAPALSLAEAVGKYGPTAGVAVLAFLAMVGVAWIGLRSVGRSGSTQAEDLLKAVEQRLAAMPQAPLGVEATQAQEAVRSFVARNPRAVAGIVRQWALER